MSKRHWFRVGSLFVITATLLGGPTATLSQDITGFQNGYLTFTNENPAMYYRVEFRPNLTGLDEWDGSFRGLRNIQSSEPEVTVPIGVFYRVVARDAPWVAGTALESDILSGKTAYVDDNEVTGTMENIGQTNIMPSTAVQTIPQGFHDGTGEVAGDLNLTSDNIRSGVTVFGVQGSYLPDVIYTNLTAAIPRTGQTASYRAGDDGNLQIGVASPTPRFSDHSNGTVTDHRTGLMWSKNANMPGGTRNWSDAIDYCATLNAGEGTYGYTDWRLPNRLEMESLLDFGRFSPALPAGHPFSNVQTEYYWTSTTRADGTQYAWMVIVSYGHVNGGLKSDPYRVWPVRGGQ